MKQTHIISLSRGSIYAVNQRNTNRTSAHPLFKMSCEVGIDVDEQLIVEAMTIRLSAFHHGEMTRLQASAIEVKFLFTTNDATITDCL